jgi:hypothetical protein
MEDVATELARLKDRVAELERLVKQAEIQAERVTVVAPDGSPRVVLANSERAPDPIIGGVKGSRSGGNAAGIYFFNERGDECGGLIFGVDERDPTAPYAFESLTFDRLGGDQVIGIQYGEDPSGRGAALRVWDRPVFTPELRARLDEAMRLPQERRAAVLAQMQSEHVFGVERLRIGRRRDESVALEMFDGEGRVRLRIAVPRTGEPTAEVIDADGGSTDLIRR